MRGLYLSGTDALRIAMICHEANRAFCAMNDDDSQVAWSEAPKWQRDSAITGVRFVFDNPVAPASANHDSWSRQKVAEGWVFGKVKDADAKTHPCLVPFEELPPHQQFKDVLFRTICLAAFAGQAVQ